MSRSLQGKNAIVTGGSRGIGKGVALELARRGANVLITYNSAQEKAETAVKEIQAHNVKSMAVQAVGEDTEAPAKVVKALVDDWGVIDIIVNAAGAGQDILIQDMDVSSWSRILDINLRFPVFLVKEAVLHFGPAPRVVNITSVMARMGGLYSGPYSASKAGLEAATKVMAQELGKKCNATFNCVMPGPTDTDLWAADTFPEVIEEWTPRITQTPAAGRIANVEDVAPIVAFLCAEESRWVTGSTVSASGGMCFS
jgi:3-oxoacyl-[acyl-carrier protein] reductase